MAENEEIVETTEQTEEQLDAELLAEAEENERAIAAESETAETETADTTDKTEPQKAGITDEEGIKIAQEFLAERGFKVALPGEPEAEKASTEIEAKQKTAEEILASLPDVDLDPAVIDAIDKKYGHDPVKRDAMFTRYATQAAMEQMASQKAQEAVAPIQQREQHAMWEAKAQATAKDITTKAEVPEAQEAVAKLILEAGPDSEERYKTDPLFKKMMDATIKQTVMEVAQSLADQDQKPLPTAERVGGGRQEAVATVDGLTGEAKAMAAEYKKDLAAGLITKAEHDSFMKDLQKEAASK